MNDETLEQCTRFICQFEGFKPNVYICPAGYPTFGCGSLRDTYPDYPLPITKEGAAELVKKDIWQKYWPRTQRLVKKDITENQKIALTSFCYNLGGAALKRSTLLRKLNRDCPIEEVAAEFKKWVRGGGRILPGLVLRREAEAKLFML